MQLLDVNFMKLKHIISLSWVVSMMFILGSAPLWAQQPPIQSASPVVVLMPFLNQNPDFFELTPSQQQQIARIAQQSNQQRESLDQGLLDLRTELREELLKYRPNLTLIQQLTDYVTQHEQQRLSLSIHCAAELRHVLTLQQWNTLIELSRQ
jgi:Spy/CpxP family protein refolding chaperone